MIDQRQVRYFEMQHRRVPEGMFFIPLADLYRRLERLEEAETLLREGLSRHPGSLSARVVLAEVLAARGEPAAAVSLWTEIRQQDPDHAWAARRQEELAAVARAVPEEAPAQAPAPPADTDSTDHAAAAVAATERDDARPDDGAGEEAGTAAAGPERDTGPTLPTAGAEPLPEPPATGELPEVFLTGTLADIYLSQGHRGKALQILRRILDQHPEREDVARRIAELEQETATGERT